MHVECIFVTHLYYYRCTVVLRVSCVCDTGSYKQSHIEY